MAQAIAFKDKGVVEIEEIDEREPGHKELKIKTLFSGISHGTEMHGYRSSEWLDRMSFLKTPGYASVGKVTDVGRNVQKFKTGDLVTSFANHVTSYIREEDAKDIAKLPLGVSSEVGVFRFNTRVALNAILDADIKIGDNVAVFGLGVIGQIAAQLAKLSGAGQVIGVDLFNKRLETAKKLGADVIINAQEVTDIKKEILEITEGRGVDLAIEASGSYKALNGAIKTVAYRGTIVVLSWYSGPAKDLYLDQEFHLKQIRLIPSQQGGINPELSYRWNKERREEVVLKLLGQLKLAELITHRFDFHQAAQAYGLIDQHPDRVIQVVLQYSSSGWL